MEMEEYLKLAKEIADGSAEIALKYFGFDVENTWKSDDTPLTKADTEINSFVIKKINSAYPEHSIAREEESHKKEGSKYVWEKHFTFLVSNAIPYLDTGLSGAKA